MQHQLPVTVDRAAFLHGVERRTFEYWQAGRGCQSPPPFELLGRRKVYWPDALKAWAKANGKPWKGEGGRDGATG